MATTTTTEITVTADGDGIESEWTPTAMSNANGPAGGPVKTPFAAGDNTLLVPTGAMGMVLKPPAASAVVLKLKAGAGETGFCLRSGQPSHIPLPTGCASVMINASDAELVHVHWT
jgi:hypothetical protein